jgi:hypothetical protein
MIELEHLDGVAALIAAECTPLRKRRGERDTAFVKRIVCAYLNAAAGEHPVSIRKAVESGART